MSVSDFVYGQTLYLQQGLLKKLDAEIMDTKDILHDVRWHHKHGLFQNRGPLSVRETCFYALKGLSLRKYKDHNTIQSVHSLAQDRPHTIIECAREDPDEVYYE